MTIRAAILEDEEFITLEYLRMLRAWEAPDRDCDVEVFAHGEALLARIRQGAAFHIIFLDIALGEGENGMQTAERLRSAGYCGLLVFSTSHTDFAFMQKGYAVGAFRYYQKPLKEEEFALCLDEALQLTFDKYLRFFSRGHRQIPYSDVIHISNSQHYVTIHTTGEDYTLKMAFKDVETSLPNCFVRCHRSFIVNMDHVLYLLHKRLYLTDDTSIDVSKTYLDRVQERIVGNIKRGKHV